MSEEGLDVNAGRCVGSMDVLFCEGAGEEPGDDWEIAAFIVGGENDRIFFLGRHCK